MKKVNATLTGRFDSLRRVPTRTGMTMFTFNVDQTPCKAFGQAAEAFLNLAPGDFVELQGSYETHSPKFGREFVPVSGRRLPNQNSVSTPSVSEEERTINKRETPQSSVASPSAPIEPISAKEPIGIQTDLAGKKASAPLSSIPPYRPLRPADECIRVNPVTFEDLENQYKELKAAREKEELKQGGRQAIEGGQVA